MNSEPIPEELCRRGSFLNVDVLEDVVAFAGCDGFRSACILRRVSRGFRAAVAGSLRMMVRAINELDSFENAPTPGGSAALGPLAQHAAEVAGVPCAHDAHTVAAVDLPPAHGGVAIVADSPRLRHRPLNTSSWGRATALTCRGSQQPNPDPNPADDSSAFHRLVLLTVLPCASSVYSETAMDSAMVDALKYLAATSEQEVSTPSSSGRSRRCEEGKAPVCPSLSHVGLVEGVDLDAVLALWNLGCPIAKLGFSSAPTYAVLGALLEWNPPSLVDVFVDEYGPDPWAVQHFATLEDLASVLDSVGNTAAPSGPRVVRAEAVDVAGLIQICEGSSTTLRSVTVTLPNTDEGLATMSRLPPTVVELSVFGTGVASPLRLEPYLRDAGLTLPRALLHLELWRADDAGLLSLIEHSPAIAANLLALSLPHSSSELTDRGVTAVAGACRSLQHLALRVAHDAADSVTPAALLSAIAVGLPFLESLRLKVDRGSTAAVQKAQLVDLAKGCVGLRQLFVDGWGCADPAAGFETAAAEGTRLRSLVQLQVDLGDDSSLADALRIVAAVPALRLVYFSGERSKPGWAGDVVSAMRRNHGHSTSTLCDFAASRWL